MNERKENEVSDDLVFYTHPHSRGRIARWMLEEASADYRTEVIEYGPDMKSAQISGHQPHGQGAGT